MRSLMADARKLIITISSALLAHQRCEAHQRCDYDGYAGIGVQYETL